MPQELIPFMQQSTVHILLLLLLLLIAINRTLPLQIPLTPLFWF
jgi:hypothetical protein